jgi:hypothetical protein
MQSESTDKKNENKNKLPNYIMLPNVATCENFCFGESRKFKLLIQYNSLYLLNVFLSISRPLPDKCSVPSQCLVVRPLSMASYFIQGTSNISHIFLVLRTYTVSVLATIQNLAGYSQSLEVTPVPFSFSQLTGLTLLNQWCMK